MFTEDLSLVSPYYVSTFSCLQSWENEGGKGGWLREWMKARVGDECERVEMKGRLTEQPDGWVGPCPRYTYRHMRCSQVTNNPSMIRVLQVRKLKHSGVPHVLKRTVKSWTRYMDSTILALNTPSPMASLWWANKRMLATRSCCLAQGPAQCYVATSVGGGSGGEWIHVHVWLSCFAGRLKLLQYCWSAIPQYKIKS